jgi:hypothetical protein
MVRNPVPKNGSHSDSPYVALLGVGVIQVIAAQKGNRPAQGFNVEATTSPCAIVNHQVSMKSFYEIIIEGQIFCERIQSPL